MPNDETVTAEMLAADVGATTRLIDEVLATGVAAAPAPAPAPPEPGLSGDWRIIPGHEMSADLAVKFQSEGALCLMEGINGPEGRRFMRNELEQWSDRRGAQPVAPGYAWIKFGNSQYYRYHFLMPDRLPEGRKCRIETQFSPSSLELIKEAPDNPIVRAHMMRVLKVEPPRELTGFEPLKDWVETNFSTPSVRRDGGGMPQAQTWNFPPPPHFVLNNAMAPATTRPEERSPGIMVPVSASENESGRCDYTARRRMRHLQSVNLNFLRHEIEVEGSGWDSLLDAIVAQADNEIVNGESDSDWERNDYEHSNYELNEHEDYESCLSNPQQAELDIRRFLEAQDMQLLETLDNN